MNRTRTVTRPMGPARVPTPVLWPTFLPCTYALVHLGFAFECGTLLGLSVPDTAFAIGVIQISASIAFGIVLANRITATTSRFDARADEWVNPASPFRWATPKTKGALSIHHSLIFLAVIFFSGVSWFQGHGYRERAVARIDRGECAVVTETRAAIGTVWAMVPDRERAPGPDPNALRPRTEMSR